MKIFDIFQIQEITHQMVIKSFKPRWIMLVTLYVNIHVLLKNTSLYINRHHITLIYRLITTKYNLTDSNL